MHLPVSLQSRLQRLRLPLLIIAVIASLISLLIITRPQQQPQEPVEKTWVVDAIVAHRQTVQPTLQLYGRIISGRESELRALVAGNVIAVGEQFREGARVSAGDMLIEIDPFDYQTNLAEQRALLAEASARLELLQRDWQRARELFRKNDVSQQYLDNAELSMEQQQAIVEQRRVALQKAQRDLQQTRLTAPYDGVLSAIEAQAGKRLNTNDRVALIIDNTQLEARFSLSNQQYGRIIEQDGTVIGRPVTLGWQVGSQLIRYPATIERIGAEIAFGSGGIDVFATLDQPDPDTLLRSGAFVRVEIADRRYENVIRLPEQALYGQDTVYVIRNQRLAAETIRIAGYEGEELLIHADGIQEGEPIVTTQIREGGVGVKVSVANLLDTGSGQAASTSATPDPAAG